MCPGNNIIRHDEILSCLVITNLLKLHLKFKVLLKRGKIKLGMDVCNHSTWEAKTEELVAEGPPWLYSKFMASLDCMRFCLKNKQKNSNKTKSIDLLIKLLNPYIVCTLTALLGQGDICGPADLGHSPLPKELSKERHIWFPATTALRPSRKIHDSAFSVLYQDWEGKVTLGLFAKRMK